VHILHGAACIIRCDKFKMLELRPYTGNAPWGVVEGRFGRQVPLECPNSLIISDLRLFAPIRARVRRGFHLAQFRI
jgi:hypothetical protein